MNDALHLSEIANYWRARDAEISAFSLARNPEAIRELMARGAWRDLLPVALLIEHDMPRDFAQTDPALYRTIRKAVTELHVQGLGYLRAADLIAKIEADEKA
jgi:hypothetical protein